MAVRRESSAANLVRGLFGFYFKRKQRLEAVFLLLGKEVSLTHEVLRCAGALAETRDSDFHKFLHSRGTLTGDVSRLAA